MEPALDDHSLEDEEEDQPLSLTPPVAPEPPARAPRVEAEPLVEPQKQRPRPGKRASRRARRRWISCPMPNTACRPWTCCIRRPRTAARRR